MKPGAFHFALSDALPKWFAGRDGSNLLSKLFDLDSVVLLGWSADKHPGEVDVDPKLHPLFARAEWHEKYSSRGDQLFRPTDAQKAFYKQTEAALLNRSASIRERGLGRDIDVDAAFIKVLGDVLGREVYRPWLDARFSGISCSTREAMLRYVQDPSAVVEDLASNGIRFNALWRGENPVFTRSLGFQTSRLFDESERPDIQRLLQSSFAIPLCESEAAVGRYGGRLEVVPWFPSDADAEQCMSHQRVMVEAVTDTELALPDAFEDFPSVINQVRESVEGRALRAAMRTIGEQMEFQQVRECWRAVAELLASFALPCPKWNAKTTVVRGAGKSVMGTVVVQSSTMAAGASTDLATAGISAILGFGNGLVFDHGIQLIRHRLRYQKLSSQLADAVGFRCSWIPFA